MLLDHDAFERSRHAAGNHELDRGCFRFVFVGGLVTSPAD